MDSQSLSFLYQNPMESHDVFWLHYNLFTTSGDQF